MSLSLKDYIEKYKLDQSTLRTLVRHGHLSSSFAEALRLEGVGGSGASSSQAPAQADAPNVNVGTSPEDDGDSLSSLHLSDVVPPTPTPNGEGSESLEELAPGQNMPAIVDEKIFAIQGKSVYHSRHCHHKSRPEVKRMTEQPLCQCAVKTKPRADGQGFLTQCYTPLFRDGLGAWHSVVACPRMYHFGRAMGHWSQLEACSQCMNFPL